MIRVLAISMFTVIALMTQGCATLWPPPSNYIDYNAPDLPQHANSPRNGSFAGYALTANRTLKFPMTLEILNYKTASHTASLSTVLGRLSLGWKSPVYQTVVVEDIAYKSQTRSFHIPESEAVVVITQLKFLTRNLLQGTILDKSTEIRYPFIVRWIERKTTEHSTTWLAKTIFPNVPLINLTSSVRSEECGINQPYSAIDFVPDTSGGQTGLFSGFQAIFQLNKTDGIVQDYQDQNLPAQSSGIIDVRSGLKIVGSDSSRNHCVYHRHNFTCGKCQFSAIDALATDTLPSASKALPQIPDGSSLLTTAHSGVFYGYVHLERPDLYQPLRLKIDSERSAAVLTTFFGTPEDNEFIVSKMRISQHQVRRGALLRGDANAIAQITWADANNIHGIIYTHGNARIGRFAARTSGLNLPPSARLTRKLSGTFISPVGRLTVLATPQITDKSDKYSPLGIAAVFSANAPASSAIIKKGAIDLDQGYLYLSTPMDRSLRLSIADSTIKTADSNFVPLRRTKTADSQILPGRQNR